MEYLTILAIIAVILIGYIIYTYVMMTSMIFYKPINLNGTSQQSYAAKLLKQASSPTYNYEFWLNIQSNSPVDEIHTILNRGDLFAFGLKGSVLSLYIAPTTASTGTITPNGNATNTIEITTTFPFQKWTQVLMNVDGNRVDLYVDGKLYKTVQLTGSIGTDSSTPVTIGNSKTIGQINRFTYWPNTVDTQAVWSRFSQGNGMSGLGSWFGKYKADMAILKDNQNIFSFSIL